MTKQPLTTLILGVALIISLGSTAYLATHNKTNIAVAAPSSTSTQSSVDSSAFQAVFLNSGQVYFGHLTFQPNGDFKLTDVYYLNQSNSSNLIKLGSEAHQPQDAMFIPKTSVTFWENLQHANQFGGQLR